MSDGFKVEYSSDGNEICIIPQRTIPFNDFCELTRCFRKLGYKWWLPADHRGGYIFTKVGGNESE